MADSLNTIPMTEIPRQIVEAEIEMLIDLLDQLDADPDLEDNADLEPSTGDEEPLHGAPEQQTGSWRGLDPSALSCDEGEELELGWTEMEGRFGRYRAAGADVYEPSLGSNGGINQLKWSKGATDDLEDEHDGREDCCEDEGAQCDDEGVIEQDTGFSEDDMVGWHSFSDSERVAIDEVADRLRALGDQGRRPVANFRAGFVSRIW